MSTRDARLQAAFTALADLAAFTNCVGVNPDVATGEPFIGVYPGELSYADLSGDTRTIIAGVVALLAALDCVQVTPLRQEIADYAKVTGRIGALPVRIMVQAKFLPLLGLPGGGA